MANTKETDFFETLAGRESGHPVADNLREALQAEAETIKNAENAKSEKLPDYEQARMDAVKKQLLEAGVLKQPSNTEPSWLSRFFNQFKSNFVAHNWGAGLAITASVLIVSTILLQQPNPIVDTGDLDTVRGGNTQTILTDNPALTVQTLKETLTKAGAEVIDAQINDTEWTLEISVPDKSKIETVMGLLAKAGVKVSDEPPYQVSVKK
ncbi:MAG TPA: hypothetical protein PL131_11220 [Methylotenera sp.]|nr:hypothetical protein [Methylotenera sp.]HPH06437.1 hypothetical protein [Methylotenera sp.]HPN00416.1 hypothetical protein [Methylotenera sp.]